MSICSFGRPAIRTGAAADTARTGHPQAQRYLGGAMKRYVRGALYGAVAVAGLGAPAGIALGQQSDTSAGSVLEEVVITAQRREERIQDVPISVTALNQEQMDAQGVRSIDDVSRLTPGITFQRADARNGAMSTISIRGIASTAGASTTGVYIDDTPIQIRALGAGGAAFNAFPGVFDLERVEVLRGPQGTLFGAGSEGGTVRFITPQPSLHKFGLYGRTELAFTEGGDPSYEVGAAFGAPLVEDKVGVRLSGWVRRDGGWVDRTDWSRAGLTAYPPGAPRPPSAPTPASVTTAVDADSNWQNSSAFKAAFAFAPRENLTITPSIYYQRVYLHDTPAFWAALSDPASGSFKNGNRISADSTDHFYLPALKIEWAFRGLRLVSNTSYFNRESTAINDYTSFETALWGQVFTTLPSPPLPPTVLPYLNGPYYPTGYTAATSYQGNLQNNIMQELRLQSDTPDARFNWVVGLYYSHNRQTAIQIVSDPDLNSFIAGLTGGIAPVLEDGKYTFVQDPVIARDEQLALYGQVDAKLSDRLIATAGIRVANAKFEATAHYHGFVVGPPVDDSGSQQEHPVTPKLGLSYKFDPDNMVYATATKGYRIGGYNPRVGLPCATNPNFSGYHTLYDSDSVWSYEVGAKNDLLDHRVRVNTSLYFIDWSDIQQTVALASCGFAYTSNLGKARSQGIDLQADLSLTHDLVAGIAVGYNDAQYTETVTTSAGTPLVHDGDHIVGWPWTVGVSAQYNFRAWQLHNSYVRLDYQYQAKQSDTVPGSNPQNGGFLPWAVFQLPETTQLSARAGTQFEGWDVSVFCNNLTNNHAILSSAASPNLGIPGVLVGHNQTTFRPRTYGITAAYRL
jgi:iron complex outermembrane recepter protein